MSRLLAVIVGCNYTDERRREVPPLRAAENDARRWSNFLHTAPLVNGELAMLTLLIGASATTPNIREAIRQASAEQNPEDTFLFYFSGHGDRTEDGLLLYSWDSQLHARELVDELNANRGPVRMILDCCHAGAITPENPTAPS